VFYPQRINQVGVSPIDVKRGLKLEELESSKAGAAQLYDCDESSYSLFTAAAPCIVCSASPLCTASAVSLGVVNCP
jgi:hypothetical protein